MDLTIESDSFPSSMQRDVCFHLLRLYSDRSYDLRNLLDPGSVTSDPLDHRLSWHLWMILRSLNYKHLPSRSQEILLSNYSAQLENIGLWEWSVFILLHNPHPLLREMSVRDLLTRHCDLRENPESLMKEKFLIEKLRLPSRWIHEAKATRSKREGDYNMEAEYLLRANHWNLCHRLVTRHLTSDAIINENYSYLRGFLDEMSRPDHCVHIQDWEMSGQVCLDYITLIDMISRLPQSGCSGYDLERLHNKVISVCNRVERIPCYKSKDRLAQSEMAKRVADILRVVLRLQHCGDSEESCDLPGLRLSLLAPHIGRLPMPEDYAMEELRSLTQSYLRELTLRNQ
ncbi:nuclear pore complex protein Nup98-Nup96-like [Mantella aurantiaca]